FLSRVRRGMVGKRDRPTSRDPLPGAAGQRCPNVSGDRAILADVTPQGKGNAKWQPAGAPHLDYGYS
ncbi:MAG: hypothetical protein ACYC1C_16555, partial [Chloroflexota bacterium]